MIKKAYSLLLFLFAGIALQAQTKPIMVDTKCQINASNVTITNNAKIIFNVANGVIIPANFVVQKGSSFVVELNK
jgi:hypothetical protein